MKNPARLFSVLVIPAFALAMAAPAVAQDKAKDAKAAPAAKAEKGGKSTVKVHMDNAKVRVTERTYKPGDTNEEVPSASFRVNRTLKGGTLERTYSDGKKEKLELKEGDVRYLEPTKGGVKYTVKNIGKTDVVSFVVQLK